MSDSPECSKDAEMAEKTAELKKNNYTFGALVNGKQFVINVDEVKHVIIYDASNNVVGNGRWDTELEVIADSQGSIEEEEWDGLDLAIAQSALTPQNDSPD